MITHFLIIKFTEHSNSTKKYVEARHPAVQQVAILTNKINLCCKCISFGIGKNIHSLEKYVYHYIRWKNINSFEVIMTMRKWEDAIHE